MSTKQKKQRPPTKAKGQASAASAAAGLGAAAAAVTTSTAAPSPAVAPTAAPVAATPAIRSRVGGLPPEVSTAFRIHHLVHSLTIAVSRVVLPDWWLPHLAAATGPQFASYHLRRQAPQGSRSSREIGADSLPPPLTVCIAPPPATAEVKSGPDQLLALAARAHRLFDDKWQTSLLPGQQLRVQIKYYDGPQGTLHSLLLTVRARSSSHPRNDQRLEGQLAHLLMRIQEEAQMHAAGARELFTERGIKYEFEKPAGGQSAAPQH